MKSAYVICILLSITISYLTLANANGAPIQTIGTQTFDVTKKAETTTTLPSSTASSTPSSTPSTTTSTSNSTTSNVTIPLNTTTAIPTTHPPTTSPTTTTSKTTSAVPTTVKPTSKPTVPSSTSEATTTAVPSSSKDRHFDGLSFFGGIILATCLMAIAVFSWKFYRQCNQENYRTL